MPTDISTKQAFTTVSAQGLLEMVENENCYFFISRIRDWDDDYTLDPSSSLSYPGPEEQRDTYEYDREIWDNMVALRKITSDEIALVARRIDWDSYDSNSSSSSDQKFFTQYDDIDPEIWQKDFYCYVTGNGHDIDNLIYKCLDNNGATESAVQPYALEPSTFTVAQDGYKWALIGHVNKSDQYAFQTENWIPVKRSSINDLQKDIQDNAVAGTVDRVEITSAGTGYTDGNWALETSNLGSDGINFDAVATVSGGSITDVTVNNAGQGYNFIDIAMPTAAGGLGAELRGVISPAGGHGFDPINELRPDHVMFSIIQRGNAYDFPLDNQFLQFGIVVNPFDACDKVIATAQSPQQTFNITVSGINNAGPGAAFQPDDLIYQGPESTPNATARVVEFDSTSNTIKCITKRGGWVENGNIYSPRANATVTELSDPDLIQGTGQIIYIANLDGSDAFTRTANTQEELRIVMGFTKP